MEANAFDEFRTYLPKYLTPEEKDELLAQLREFPRNQDFYLRNGPEDDLLQGDGWYGFVAINFQTLRKKTVSGVILSNSCDIDVNNKRDVRPNILFAPLIALPKYEALLKQARVPDGKLQQKLETIKQQKVTAIFYLPPPHSNQPEYIVPLDDVHSHPLANFSATGRSRIFRLNQYAFYIFLFKLSIHLTRFKEEVHRFNRPVVTT
jgi:hypothetical protein